MNYKKHIVFFIALLTAYHSQSQNVKTDSFNSYPDSGFTNKAEAKNLKVNGLKEGKWVEYFDHWGHKIINRDSIKRVLFETYVLTIYRGGKPLGIVREYGWDNSGPWDKTYYINGVKNGMERYYVRGIGEWDETPYINGLENGVEKEFYRNGKIKSETTYVNGIKQGSTKNFDENGNEIKK